MIFLAVYITACGNKQPYSVIPAKSTVVILGDSLSFGTGAGKGEDYVSILASNTGWNIVNASVPGSTSADGLERTSALLADIKIDLLIIELGGNDFLRRLPENETVSNLKAILAQAKAKHIQTLLLPIPEFSPVGAAFGNLSDHPLYTRLSEETDTPLVEDVFSDVLANNALKADQIHPNAEGYRVVEAHLRQAFIEMGFLAGNKKR
jgi:acyl-CoA thioesterase I